MAGVTSPASGTASAPNYPLLIQANAGDADGSITRVDFLAGTNWLASDYSTPFSFRWQHVPGSTNVNIIARAYDNSGASADSAPVPVRIQSTIYSANMDSDPGWTLGSGWQFGNPSGYYVANYSTDEGDPSSGHTGNNVIGYLFNDVLPALSSAVCAVTPAIDCRGYSNVVLTFYYWLGIGETYNNFRAGIDISTNGTSWQSLWTNPSERMTVGLWRRMALNISAIADGKPTVYIRWTMGPGNAYYFCGWNIDDVEVLGSAPPPVIADADGDGMPDNWEIACFGNTNHTAAEDWDGDGLSNYQEYLAGTAPTGSTNALQLHFDPFNRDAILFDAVEAVAGYYLVPRYYSLESRTNLLSGQWTGIPGLTNILGENQPVAYTNAAPGSAFYRLRSWLP